ncbi:hypothetical protein BD769DRAFT_545425 [Suillus cothurnatus]|nr:hypothetical protein BD769DRAFT_545425 [Suillus cothurnatus]
MVRVAAMSAFPVVTMRAVVNSYAPSYSKDVVLHVLLNSNYVIKNLSPQVLDILDFYHPPIVRSIYRKGKSRLGKRNTNGAIDDHTTEAMCVGTYQPRSNYYPQKPLRPSVPLSLAPHIYI